MKRQSMMANANSSLLNEFLISGTERTQMETRLPIRPKAATSEEMMPSDQ